MKLQDAPPAAIGAFIVFAALAATAGVLVGLLAAMPVLIVLAAISSGVRIKAERLPEARP